MCKLEQVKLILEDICQKDIDHELQNVDLNKFIDDIDIGMVEIWTNNGQLKIHFDCFDNLIYADYTPHSLIYADYTPHRQPIYKIDDIKEIKLKKGRNAR